MRAPPAVSAEHAVTSQPPATEPTWADVLSTLIAGTDLDAATAAWVMGRAMDGEAPASVLGGVLVGLRAKGETVAELSGLSRAMIERARPLDVPRDLAARAVDIVGTGGDRMHTVNVSTMSSLVVAGAGVPVIKHGNRASSSSSGSADVLEALGLDLAADPARVAEIVRECGITFCFAQVFHPAMRHAAVPRRELGIPTVFNVLGPLTNPGRPHYGAVGVADARMAPLIAGVFAGRGQRVAVFRGDDGLDELTPATTSTVWWVGEGDEPRTFTLDPTRLGLTRHPVSALRGGDAGVNAEVVRELLRGAPGAVRDVVLLNAGMALAVVGADTSGRAVDSDEVLHAVVADGIEQARVAIDSGAAGRVLEAWRAATTGR